MNNQLMSDIGSWSRISSHLPVLQGTWAEQSWMVLQRGLCLQRGSMPYIAIAFHSHHRHPVKDPLLWDAPRFKERQWFQSQIISWGRESRKAQRPPICHNAGGWGH